MSAVDFDPWQAERTLQAGSFEWQPAESAGGSSILHARNGIHLTLAGIALHGESLRVQFDQPTGMSQAQLQRLQLDPTAEGSVAIDTRLATVRDFPLRGEWRGQQLVLGREQEEQGFAYRGRMLDLAPWQAVWRRAQAGDIHLQGASGSLEWRLVGQNLTGSWQQPQLREMHLFGAPATLGVRLDAMRWALRGTRVSMVASQPEQPHIIVDQGTVQWQSGRRAAVSLVKMAIGHQVQIPLVDGTTSAGGTVVVQAESWQLAAAGWRGKLRWHDHDGLKRPMVTDLELIGDKKHRVTLSLKPARDDSRTSNQASGWLQSDRIRVVQEATDAWILTASGNVQLQASLPDGTALIPVRGLAQSVGVHIRWQADANAMPVVELIELTGPVTDPAQWFAAQKSHWFRAIAGKIAVQNDQQQMDSSLHATDRLVVRMGVDGRLGKVDVASVPTWSAPALPDPLALTN